MALSRGAAGDCHRSPARGEGGEPRRARPRQEGVRLSGKAETQVFLSGLIDYCDFWFFRKPRNVGFIVGWSFVLKN